MMKKVLTVAAFTFALFTWYGCGQQQNNREAFAPIKVETPARPAGQEDVVQLVTPKMDTMF